MKRLALFALAVLVGCGGMSLSGQRRSGNPHPGPGNPIMGRQRTTGFEVGLGDAALDGIRLAGAPVLQTTVVHSGSKAVKCDTGAGSAQQGIDVGNVTFNDGTIYYSRSFFYFENFPVTSWPVFTIHSLSGTDIAFATLFSDASIELGVNGTPHVARSAAGLIPTNTWVRIEIALKTVVGVGDYAELSVNGVSVGSISGATIADSIGIPQVYLGWMNASGAGTPGANKVCYIDDYAVNDSSGSTQNFWPGEGKIVWDPAVSDNARGANWLDGGGGTTNLFSAVDNNPPVGSGTPAAGTQVKNTAKDTTGNYDANLQTYANIGIQSADQIVLVHPVFNIGATKSVTGAEQFVSNPTGPAETSIDFFAGAAAGTWPTNWRTDWLAAIVGDISQANRTVNPVIRIGKRQSSTNAAYCDLMGAYVEYISGPLAPYHRSAEPDRPPRKKIHIGY